MIFDVRTFDDIVKLPIRPQAQFFMRSTVYSIGGHVVAANVSNGDVNFTKSGSVAPNPNNLKPAMLSKNGYCVDDPTLRVMNSSSYCNLMFTSLLFTDLVLTRNLFYAVQHPFDEVFTISITIAPIYIGSFRFDWIEYNIDTEEILSTQSITLTATTESEALEFETNPTTTETAYKLMATALDADAVNCRITFDVPTKAGETEFLITNANLINYSSTESADLYSQRRSNFEHTVEFLDMAHLYDPINPKGRFASMVIGSSYRIYVGYNINGVFIDADASGWSNTIRFCYLKDLPIWENEKVTLHLADGHTFDSNLSTQVPYPNYNASTVALKNFASTTSDRGLRVLTQMDYKIRFQIGPYKYGGNVSMTIEDAAKRIMETTGYLTSDYPIEDVYSLAQNALGCWNYGKNISDISAANVRDYTIDESVIYDEGISLNKQPLLKTLTIKKYNNTQNSEALVYDVALQASDFVKWSETDVRPYRAELITDNPLTDIATLMITSSNLNNWVSVKIYDRDLVSGLCRWRLYIYAVNPNAGAGTYTITLHAIETTTEDISEVINEEGDNLTIDNPFITSDALVTLCADAAKKIARWRDVYEIDVIENFKLRIGDIVKLDTIYEKGIPVIITGLQFSIPGPKGHITCRRID